MNLNEFAKGVYENAVAHGWWETDRDIAETIALIHSEWSEALEEYRAGRPMLWYQCDAVCNYVTAPCKIGELEGCKEALFVEKCTMRSKKPEGIAVELIDGVIRIFDYLGKVDASFNGMDTLDDAMEAAYDEEYKVGLTTLIADLHSSTANAYVNLMAADIYPIAATKGYGFMLSCIANACCWIREQGLDPEAIMLEKHEYNKGRPYKHGGKVC